MEPKDNEQYSTPQDEPKHTQPEPQLPGDEEEKNIKSGAKNTDQLDKLQPEESEKAKNEIGAPPFTQADKGDKTA